MQCAIFFSSASATEGVRVSAANLERQGRSPFFQTFHLNRE